MERKVTLAWVKKGRCGTAKIVLRFIISSFDNLAR
jgi:hypothetical protein